MNTYGFLEDTAMPTPTKMRPVHGIMTGPRPSPTISALRNQPHPRPPFAGQGRAILAEGQSVLYTT